MPVIIPNTTAEANEQAQMLREGLQVHDEGCCTASVPCTLRVGMQAVLDQLTAGTTRPAPRVEVAKHEFPGKPGNPGFGDYRADGRNRFATDPQKGMIRKLAAAKAVTEYLGQELEAFLAGMKKSDVDAARLFMLNQPWPDRKPAKEVVTRQSEAVEPGMYRKDGVVYKVQIAVHGSGLPYAKKLVQGGDEWFFAFARGAIRDLTPEHRMTLADAKEFGDLYGVCVRCGATLTDEASIERGVGPVCAGKI